MRVAIHQPNFLPWMGIFQRAFLVDTFVFFDHVQAMGGRSWLSRNKLLVAGAEAWFSMPVRKAGRLGQRVDDVEIDYHVDFVPKHLKTLTVNYRKAQHFDAIFPAVEALYLRRHRRIADFNIDFMTWATQLLGLDLAFVRSSELAREHPALVSSTGNELVLATCRALNARDYVSGTGCLDFIDPAAFEREGVQFYFQRFEHPVYGQVGSRQFVSHLSVLDALFNVGAEATRAMIAQPTRERATEAA